MVAGKGYQIARPSLEDVHQILAALGMMLDNLRGPLQSHQVELSPIVGAMSWQHGVSIVQCRHLQQRAHHGLQAVDLVGATVSFGQIGAEADVASRHRWVRRDLRQHMIAGEHELVELDAKLVRRMTGSVIVGQPV